MNRVKLEDPINELIIDELGSYCADGIYYGPIYELLRISLCNSLDDSLTESLVESLGTYDE